MFTLHRIRDLTLAVTLGMGAVVSSATLACEEPAARPYTIALFADLGQMTVEAPRTVADLGSMTVSATRLASIESQFADLGAMTVTAARVAETQVADLGAMTVEASRIKTLMVAARPAKRAFN